MTSTTKAIPAEMTRDMLLAVRMKSELGAYALANLSGGYDLLKEFWKVAVEAAPDATQPAPSGDARDEMRANLAMVKRALPSRAESAIGHILQSFRFTNLLFNCSRASPGQGYMLAAQELSEFIDARTKAAILEDRASQMAKGGGNV